MGESGVDVKINELLVPDFPWAIECGNAERVSFWRKWVQAERNAEALGKCPVLVLGRNRQAPVAVIPWDTFVVMARGGG